MPRRQAGLEAVSRTRCRRQDQPCFSSQCKEFSSLGRAGALLNFTRGFAPGVQVSTVGEGSWDEQWHGISCLLLISFQKMRAGERDYSGESEPMGLDGPCKAEIPFVSGGYHSPMGFHVSSELRSTVCTSESHSYGGACNQMPCTIHSSV